jgi:hypothetical protein
MLTVQTYTSPRLNKCDAGLTLSCGSAPSETSSMMSADPSFIYRYAHADHLQRSLPGDFGLALGLFSIRSRYPNNRSGGVNLLTERMA